jgi:hypothetical protein
MQISCVWNHGELMSCFVFVSGVEPRGHDVKIRVEHQTEIIHMFLRNLVFRISDRGVPEEDTSFRDLSGSFHQ